MPVRYRRRLSFKVGFVGCPSGASLSQVGERVRYNWPGDLAAGVSVDSKLERVEQAIRKLRLGRMPGGRETPHKLVLLLTVLDIADEDARLSGNQICKDEDLKRLFRKHLRVHDKEGIYLKAEDPLDAPFKRLESSLWSLQKDSSRKLYASLSGSSGK